MTTAGEIQQVAPDPVTLRKLVESLSYKPGWTFRLIDDLDRDQGSKGMTIDVVSCTFNSYHPERGNTYKVHHYLIVPPASYDVRSWRRWLLDRLIEIERHEVCEFFMLDGEKPYAPSHAPGNDPYMIREVGTEEDVRTSFRGVVKE